MRYAQLDGVIAIVKPQSIVEVGTWNGDRAIQMATEALKHQKKVDYLGFDLFENASRETDDRELNVKAHFSLEEVDAKLKAFAGGNPGFSYALTKGDTRDTLGNHTVKADLVFLDGGHSIETIRNDFEAVKTSKVVVLDDFYVQDETGCPDIDKFGCNQIVSKLPHLILPLSDGVRGGGRVAMAVIADDATKSALAMQMAGPKRFRVKTKNCVPDKNIQANVKYALTLCEKWVEECNGHDMTAVICSAGPSLMDYIDEIKKLSRSKKHRVFCVKHSHDKLIENGVIPFGCLLLDPRAHVQDFIENPHPKVNYFTASMCHPTTWDQLFKTQAKVWGYHAKVGAGEDEIVKEGFFVTGGSTSATRGMVLINTMGFRKYILIGFDSSFRSKPDDPKAIKVDCSGRKFWTTPELVAQSDDIKNIMKSGLFNDMEIRGDGMIAHIWSLLRAVRNDFGAVYE